MNKHRSHNRFNTLSNIDVCESNTNEPNENTASEVCFVNKNKQVNGVKSNKVWKNQNRQLTTTKDCEGKRSHNVNGTTRYQGNRVSLVENDDKYDLELNFKPRHRQRIAHAKNNTTFNLCDKQTNDKYGFISLGDQILPEKNEKNKINLDRKKLHQIVKNSDKSNFMDAQIEVPSQLNPDRWEDYLTDYWDKQLCYLIRYGFPLDFKQNCPL